MQARLALKSLLSDKFIFWASATSSTYFEIFDLVRQYLKVFDVIISG